MLYDRNHLTPRLYHPYMYRHTITSIYQRESITLYMWCVSIKPMSINKLKFVFECIYVCMSIRLMLRHQHETETNNEVRELWDRAQCFFEETGWWLECPHAASKYIGPNNVKDVYVWSTRGPSEGGTHNECANYVRRWVSRGSWLLSALMKCIKVTVCSVKANIIIISVHMFIKYII